MKFLVWCIVIVFGLVALVQVYKIIKQIVIIFKKRKQDKIINGGED